MFLLTGNNILYYLFNFYESRNDELFIRSGIVKNDTTTIITELFLSSRNCTFSFKNDDKSIFLKQPKNFDEDRVRFINIEATFYKLLNELGNNDLKDKTNKLVFFDKSNSILGFEFFENSEKVTQNFVKNRPTNFSQNLGSLIGSFHKIMPCNETLFEKTKPWILDTNFERLIYLLQNSKVMNVRIIADKMVLFKDRVLSIDSKWKYDSLTHNDLCVRNLIFVPNDEKSENLRLIDWELASIGDGVWDLAVFCSSFYKKSRLKGDKSFVDKATNSVIIRNLLNSYHTTRYGSEPTSEFIDKFLGLLAIKILQDYISDLETERKSSQQDTYPLIAFDLLKEFLKIRDEIFKK